MMFHIYPVPCRKMTSKFSFQGIRSFYSFALSSNPYQSETKVGNGRHRAISSQASGDCAKRSPFLGRIQIYQIHARELVHHWRIGAKKMSDGRKLEDVKRNQATCILILELTFYHCTANWGTWWHCARDRKGKDRCRVGQEKSKKLSRPIKYAHIFSPQDITYYNTTP